MATLATPGQIGRTHWRAVLDAMSKTGGVALLSGLFSLLVVKVFAVTLGPGPVAQWGSLQQLRQVGLTAATLGGQTALIQGASALSGREREEFLRATALLMAIATVAVAGLLSLAPGWVAERVGLTETETNMVRWMGPVIGLGAFGVYLTGLLTAERAIGTLALVQITGPVTAATMALPVALLGGSGQTMWLVGLLGASAAITFAVAAGPFFPHLRHDFFRGSWWNASAARRFLTITGSLLASSLFAHAVMVVARSRVLKTEGLEVGGQFDAAWAISMSQTGVVLASLQSFYLPSLASERTSTDRAAHIERVLTLACLMAAAGITGIAALKPLFLKTLYSPAFFGAARFLRWTLAGDYLKVSSWILSIPFLATGNIRTFLIGDVVAYGTFGVAAWGLAGSMGAAEASAVAFVLMYAVHLLFYGVRLWGSGEFRPTTRVMATWTAGAAAVTISSILFWNQ